ncbi:DUF4158 domain-containing protein [Streptomyces sp. ME109]|uniref:DUF4158 domain-containing protein n=1 Tax=Streptomyces sp. me109 TaxID=1827853 RepID=UPI0011CE2CC3|nr:DUF4158 domain-containing protein [Streptomyces sp. me109]
MARLGYALLLKPYTRPRRVPWPKEFPDKVVAFVARQTKVATPNHERQLAAPVRRGSRTAAAAPSTPVDFPFPGESPPSAPPTAEAPGSSAPPTDHHAHNQGAMVLFPLHGQRRCEGLAAVRCVLEPPRVRRGDFPVSTRSALTGLGYFVGKAQS